MEKPNRIREIRRGLKQTGPEIARKLSISTQYLYDIEKGRRGLNSEIASNISDIFKVTTDYLLAKTDVNNYHLQQENKKSSDPHEESELSEIPIEKLNTYKLTYKGHELSKEDGDAIAEILEAALKRWKK